MILGFNNVMQALMDGKKIRLKSWTEKSHYIHLVDGNILFDCGKDGKDMITHFNNWWEIFQEPKQKREYFIHAIKESENSPWCLDTVFRDKNGNDTNNNSPHSYDRWKKFEKEAFLNFAIQKEVES